MLSSPGMHTARLHSTDTLELIGSYNRVKWMASSAAAAGGGGRLHGEDAVARSALIPLPACLPACLPSTPCLSALLLLPHSPLRLPSKLPV